MSKVEVQVEGDLNLDDDVSSSESERESENGGGNNEPPLEFSDDEEESLEVFSKAPVKPKVAAEKPKPVAAPTLNEIVNTKNEFEPQSDEGIDITFDDAGDEPDEFGIKYKKSTDTKKSKPKPVESDLLIDTPIDIAATLQAMKTNNTANDDEDEFGFDSPEPNSNTSDAIKKALESAANREIVENTSEIAVDNSEFLISQRTAASNGPVYQPVDEPILANNSHNNAKKGSALADARKAYQDVIEVYGGGMGDVEVLLLDDNNKATATVTSINTKMPLTAQIDKSVKGNVIEEGDEDEEEEEELLESTRQLEIVQKNNRLQAEWENVQPSTGKSGGDFAIVNEDDEFLNSGAGVDPSTNATSGGVSSDYTEVNYKTAFAQVKATPSLKQFESQIVISEKQQTSSWFGLGRSSEISYSGYSVEDLKLPFLIAQLDYEPSVHINMLRTIYHFCIPSSVGSSTSLGATGPHWEKIGFQGVDPRTDLNRSMKMLSILQMLEFIETDANFVRQLHTLSGSADAASSHVRSSKMDMSWPFMCVAIMFTKESIQALRSGVLNAKCSKYESVMKAINTFHHSCFFEFYRLLTEQPTVHHAVHLAALRKQCSENPLKVMNAYRNHLKRPTITTSVNPTKSTADKQAAPTELLTKFDNLESIDDDKSNEKESSGWTLGGKASKFQVK